VGASRYLHEFALKPHARGSYLVRRLPTETGAPAAQNMKSEPNNCLHIPRATPPSVLIAMQPPCQSRKSGFGSWHQWAMKTAIIAPAVTRAQSKGQQGPGRRSAIANFDHPLSVYVLRPPNCSTSQFVAIRNSSKPPICHCASMAGLAVNPVQVFSTLRVLHWEFLSLWTGFELPIACRALP
jgi:hypothetical protein